MCGPTIKPWRGPSGVSVRYVPVRTMESFRAKRLVRLELGMSNWTNLKCRAAVSPLERAHTNATRTRVLSTFTDFSLRLSVTIEFGGGGPKARNGTIRWTCQSRNAVETRMQLKPRKSITPSCPFVANQRPRMPEWIRAGSECNPCGASPQNTEDLFDNRASPRTESMVAAAMQWAERMRKIDNVFSGK